MNGRIRVCVHVLHQHVAAVNTVKLEGRKWEVAQGIIRLEIACRWEVEIFQNTELHIYKQKHTYTNWRSWWPERRGGTQRAVRHDTTDDQNQEVQFAYLRYAATCSAHTQGEWQGYEDVSSNHLSHSDTFTNMYIDTHRHMEPKQSLIPLIQLTRHSSQHRWKRENLKKLQWGCVYESDNGALSLPRCEMQCGSST